MLAPYQPAPQPDRVGGDQREDQQQVAQPIIIDKEQQRGDANQRQLEVDEDACSLLTLGQLPPPLELGSDLEDAQEADETQPAQRLELGEVHEEQETRDDGQQVDQSPEAQEIGSPARRIDQVKSKVGDEDGEHDHL